MAGSLLPELVTVEKLFASSLFEVPDYQRAYAWEQKQWDDLWDDVTEGMRTKTTHFLGTVVLMEQETTRRDSKGRSLKVFDVVDGQQRLTTLSLLFLAVFRLLRQEDESISRGLYEDFIEHEHALHRLRLGGLNAEYFAAMIGAAEDGVGSVEDGGSPRSSNVRLKNAVGRLHELIVGWREADAQASILDLAHYMRENLQILRFVTDSRPLAIKMFQTVNDRGKELSLLDKAKSFLMFYVTQYLQEDGLLSELEATFGHVFDNFDTVRDLASSFGVDYLVNPRYRFSEDEFLRYAYHYGYDELRSKFALEVGYEYNITPERIFDDFIKGACHDLRDRPDKLREFVVAWSNILRGVSDALVSLLSLVPQSAAHQRFLQFQGPSADMYPLIVGAQARGILDEEMLDAVAILDLRVYQVRGTGPKAELYRNAVANMQTGDRADILRAVIEYCQMFGNDHEVDRHLRGPVYRYNFAKYVLWSYATALDPESDALDYRLYADCQVDHILPQDTDRFDVTTFGFSNREDYESSKDGFGNLVPLEERLNKRAQNSTPGEKHRVYDDSKLRSNRILAARIKAASGFRRGDREERTDKIVAFFKAHWAIPSLGGNGALRGNVSPGDEALRESPEGGAAAEDYGYIPLSAREAMEATHDFPAARQLVAELSLMPGRFRKSTASSLLFQWAPRGWHQRLLSCFVSGSGKARVEWVRLESVIEEDAVSLARVRAFCDKVARLADAPIDVQHWKPPAVLAARLSSAGVVKQLSEEIKELLGSHESVVEDSGEAIS